MSEHSITTVEGVRDILTRGYGRGLRILPSEYQGALRTLDALVEMRDDFLQEIGRLKEEAGAARSELNSIYEARDVSRDRLIDEAKDRQRESEKARKALRDDVEKAIAALVAAL